MNQEMIKSMFDEMSSPENFFLPTYHLKQNHSDLQKAEKDKELKILKIHSSGYREEEKVDIELERLLEYDFSHLDCLNLFIYKASYNIPVIKALYEKNKFKYLDITILKYQNDSYHRVGLINDDLFVCDDEEDHAELNRILFTIEHLKELSKEIPDVTFIVRGMFLKISVHNEVEIIAVRGIDTHALTSRYYAKQVDYCMLYNESIYERNKKKALQIFSDFSKQYPDTKIHTLLEYTPNELILKQHDFIDTKGKHEKNYVKIVEECSEFDSTFVQTLMFSLLKRTLDPIEFTPSKETLFKLIKCSVAPVKKEAFIYFDQYYLEKSGIENKKIFLAGTMSNYKVADIKDKLENIGSKVVKTLETSDLVVLGHKSKLETIEVNKPIITESYFELLLSDLGEKVLESNENTTEKLNDLLDSDDDSNVEVALNLMIDGGLHEKLIPMVFAIFKTHQSTKVKKLAKEVLIKNPHKIIDDVMALIGKRNIVSIADEKKIVKLYDELSEIKGFDVEQFKRKVVLSSGLGAFLYAEDESDFGKEIILKYLNQNQLFLFNYKINNPHFLEATNIRDLRCKGGEVIWKMDFLRHLVVSNKEHVVVNASALPSLTGLWVYTKSVDLYAPCKISKNSFSLDVSSIKHIDKSFVLDAPWVSLKVKDKIDTFTPFISPRTERIDFTTKKLIINDDFCEAIENSNIKQIYFEFKELVVETTRKIVNHKMKFDTEKNRKKLNEIFSRS